MTGFCAGKQKMGFCAYTHLLVRPHDGRKRLVELPDRDVLFRDPGPFQRQRNGLGGRDGEIDGVDGGVGRRDDAREHAAALPVLLGDALAPEDEGRGAVVHARRVTRRDGAAVFLERGPQRRELGLVELVVAFVARDDGVAFLPLHRHGGDLVVELPFLPRRLCASVRLHRIRVLRLPRDIISLRRLLRTDAHVNLIVDVPQAVLDEAVLELQLAERRLLRCAREVVRDARHALHAAGDLGVGEAELDVLGREDDGLHAGGADLVDGDGFGGRGEAGEDGGLPGGRLADAALEHVAHVHVCYFGGGHLGALEGGADGGGAEVRGGDAAEGSIELR